MRDWEAHLEGLRRQLRPGDGHVDHTRGRAVTLTQDLTAGEQQMGARTELVDALMIECEIEYKIQAIILGLLKAARDLSLKLKSRSKDDLVPKFERTKDQRMWRSDLRRILLAKGFAAENFDQAVTTLENKRRVHVYSMTANNGSRGQVVALRVFEKGAVAHRRECKELGITPGDVFRIFGNGARTWLTEENIKEILTARG